MSTVIAILCFSLLLSQVSAAPRLTLDVLVPISAVGVDRLTLKTRLKNTGNVPLKLIKNPNSILSRARTNIFKISSKTCTPQFTGLNVRYDLSHAAKWIGASGVITLAPGMTTEVEHNLAGTYDFTQCGEGSYKITASNTFYYIDESGKPNVIIASTRSRQLKIMGVFAAPRQHAKTGIISEPGIKVIGCTDNQKEQVEKAINAANTMINESNRYLASLTQASSQPKRYTTWFGAINDLRYKSTGSTESQAGLIIRELSHSAETETLDLVYGIEGARALVAKDAWLGIMNADNYMYFAKKGSGLSFITTR